MTTTKRHPWSNVTVRSVFRDWIKFVRPVHKDVRRMSRHEGRVAVTPDLTRFLAALEKSGLPHDYIEALKQGVDE